MNTNKLMVNLFSLALATGMVTGCASENYVSYCVNLWQQQSSEREDVERGAKVKAIWDIQKFQNVEHIFMALKFGS